MNASVDTAEGDELDVLATLVDAFENEKFPIKTPDPIAAIIFRMNQMGYSRKDLEPFIGSRARVSEVLNRKRRLSIRQIRQLHSGLNIPLENLIGSD
jgi:HTH-type transcriptional regulator/antitoxin HigA